MTGATLEQEAGSTAVVDLLGWRAKREVPLHLEAFIQNASCMAELVLSSEKLAEAFAWELRRQLRSRGLNYSVRRQRRCVLLTDHAACVDLRASH